jgi:flagellin-like hook-associated protein FlgL
MRVTNKMTVNNYNLNLMRTHVAMDNTSNEVTSGRRINLPSDDPVGTANSMYMNSTLSEISQFKINSQDASTWMNSTDNALSTVDSYLQRVYELVVAGSTDSTTPDSRSAQANEIDQIAGGLLEVANTNIDNRYIFAGEKVREPAYNERATVSGDALDLRTNPVQIDLMNNQLKVKLDNNTTQNIYLTPKVYDGSPGNTINDLTSDIQAQLTNLGQNVPIYVKATPGNKLEFYAGGRPPENTIDTLVLKEGPAIKLTGNAMVPINPLTFPGPNPDNQHVELALNANANDGYYNGWNITITSGKGVGQTRTITDYKALGTIPATDPDRDAIVDTPWFVQPDNTSTYSITPPLDGRGSTVYVGPPPTSNDFSLSAPYSNIANFYTGMDINFTDKNGHNESRQITAYNNLTGNITVNGLPWSETANYDYTITPHLAGTATGGGVSTINLAANANQTDDFYKGTSIIVTDANGTVETKKITGYAAGVATVDSPWINPPTSTSTYKISDTTLSQLGFENRATTKEIVGDSLKAPILVAGKYPLVDNAQDVAGSPLNKIGLSANASETDNYYNNWTVTITSGQGVNQTATITGYNAATKQATFFPAGAVAPDHTSIYSLEPPAVGGVAAAIAPATAQAGTAGSITLANTDSKVDNYYNGWTVTVTAGPGSGPPNQSRVISPINGYDGKAQTATVAANWNAGDVPDNTSTYVLTPPTKVGTATAANITSTPNTVTLAANSSINDNTYNGWTMTLTSGPGIGESKTINGYNAATQIATTNGTWLNDPTGQTYTLTPPPVATNQIHLNQASNIKDFYVGMPITITDGSGKGQTRTITAYNEESQIATVDREWAGIPDNTSMYSIDTHFKNVAANKFKISVGTLVTQEIDLDGGNYSLKDFAKEVQSKIHARGGEYANVQVSLTADNQLRMRYEDSNPDDNDKPLDIKLESGTTADMLWRMGFSNGAHSEAAAPNYEGDKGITEYEINPGIKMSINVVGENIFDSVFKHLSKISMDLRAGNTKALGNNDIVNIKADIENILVSQGALGAKVNRMDKAVDRLDVLNQNMQKLLSNVEDVDVSKTIIQLQMEQTSYQAALQVGGRILPQTLMDYLK